MRKEVSIEMGMMDDFRGERRGWREVEKEVKVEKRVRKVVKGERKQKLKVE